jgi:hypothetical protein
MRTKYTAELSRLPFLLHCVNWVGKLIQKGGAGRRNFSEESVVAAARRRTGLPDPLDEDFRGPLRILLADYRDNANFSFIGSWGLRRLCVEIVTNRLLIQDALRRHPEITQTPIRKPLFVVGLPRTGTTLLYNLLAQDPAGRPLLAWETLQPALSARDEARARDWRIASAKFYVGLLNTLAPQLRIVHAIEATGPEECTNLLANCLVSAHLVDPHMPHYTEWLLGLTAQTTVHAYQRYREQLQTLAWRHNGGHWVLKSSAHLLALDALFTVFPDAHVVHNHRDLNEVVPSLCSLYATTLGAVYERLDLAHLGRFYVRFWSSVLERALEARRRLDPAALYDLSYYDLVADPVNAVRQIYHFFGNEFGDGLEARMRAWLTRNPQHKFGRHRYDLDQFGLAPEDLGRAFQSYKRGFHCEPTAACAPGLGQETREGVASP